jgi:hypothetical protein
MSAISLSLSGDGYAAVAALQRLAANNQPTTAAASGTPDSQDAAVINAVDINAVPLDIASYGAIMGSTGGTEGYSARDPAAFQDAMEMIGEMLSQARGGYYLASNAPGRSLMTAMAPGQLQAYMQSKGALYPDTLISSNGHSYSLYDLLNQAFAANARTQQMQQADPAAANPDLTVAETLLNQMKADSASAGSAQLPPLRTPSAGPDAAKSIRALVLQMDASGSNSGVRLSIVYFPPSAGNGPQDWGPPATTMAAPETLQLVA